MADISWSAYALAMFTPEQRAAAAGLAYVPEEPRVPLPPVPPPAGGVVSAPIVYVGLSTAHLRDSTGLDPNDPSDQAVLNEQGWTFVGGEWFKRGGASTTGGAGNSPSGAPRPTGASFQSASSFGGGSVLGYSVPVAPPVLLPNWINGRIGVIRQPGGYRPESGGTPLFQKPIGKSENWMRVEVPSRWER